MFRNFRPFVALVVCSASAWGADIDLFASAESTPVRRTTIEIKNRMDVWPSVRETDRLAMELENLDEGDTVAEVQVTGFGQGEKNRDRVTYTQLIDLPDEGRKMAILPLYRVYGKVDRRRIESVRIALEEHAARRFRVCRMMLVRTGTPPPVTREAVRRHRADERAHTRDLAAFRRRARRGGLVVGLASSMQAVRPRAGFSVAPADAATIHLARNEFESIQLVVTSVTGNLEAVSVSFSGFDGFPTKDISAAPVGYVETREPPPYVVRPAIERPSRGWWPDAILTFTNATDIAEGDVQSFWVKVHCPTHQPKGVYRGVAQIAARTPKGQRLSATVPMSIRVYDFTLPRKSSLPLAVSFWPSAGSKVDAMEETLNRRREDPDGLVRAWERQEQVYGDFLADCLMTWDNLYFNARCEPRFDVLERLKAEGRLGCFNLSYWWYFMRKEGSEARWQAKSLPLLRERYEKAKARGLLDHAYFYGCDEVNSNCFEDVARTLKRLHKEFPGVPFMTTARDPRLGVDGSPLVDMDIFCPATCFWNPEQVRKSRAAGHKVWWYFCNVPSYPYANALLETPPIEIRSLMGAQTVKYRPDGFLYYATASWNGDHPIMSTFYDWNPRTFGVWHGDGQWTCCGGQDKRPLPTLRLENFRDGLEDYAYALEYERATGKSCEVPVEVCRNLEEFTVDPQVLYAWREKLAQAIEGRADASVR